MITSEKEYLRLPGAGRRRTGPLSLMAPRSTLWLGANHLLSVDFWGYSEDYHRFSYADIQAIAVRSTPNFVVRSVVLTLVTLTFAALGRAAAEGWSAASYIVGGLAGVLLLRELILGPTCRTYLTTAVQTEELPSLGRLRAFRRAMERLAPMIAGAQGSNPAPPPEAPPGPGS